MKRNNFIGKKSKAAKVWRFDDHILVNPPPFRVSVFPNGSSRILPLCFPLNFKTDWEHVTSKCCCVTVKRSNVLRLRTRPCKLSQQHQEADLEKKIFSAGRRSWRPESIFILKGQGAEWNRAKGPWREKAVYKHKDFFPNMEKLQKYKTLKLWKAGNQIVSDQLFLVLFCFVFYFPVMTPCLSECKLRKWKITKSSFVGKLPWIFMQHFAIVQLFHLKNYNSCNYFGNVFVIETWNGNTIKLIFFLI